MRTASRFVGLLWIVSAYASFAWPVQSVETRAMVFEGKRMVVTEVDVAKDRLQLFLNDEQGVPFKRFARLNAWLGERKQQLRWATNAGMYHRDYSAVGLFVSDGKTLFPLNLANDEGNFFLKPNGVFFLTEQGAGILRSEEYAARKPAATLATQSGPALVLRGQMHPAFRPGSMNRLHRNGVGVASPQKVFFVITDGLLPLRDDEARGNPAGVGEAGGGASRSLAEETGRPARAGGGDGG